MADFPIKVQGNLSLGQTVIYSPSQGRNGLIKTINFANSAGTAYTVSLYRIINGSTINLLYIFNLSSGYVLVDDNGYDIAPNDSLAAIGSQTTINFVINGEEQIK